MMHTTWTGFKTKKTTIIQPDEDTDLYYFRFKFEIAKLNKVVKIQV